MCRKIVFSVLLAMALPIAMSAQIDNNFNVPQRQEQRHQQQEQRQSHNNQQQKKMTKQQIKIIIDNLINNMVRVEGGMFQMGNNESRARDWEKPHMVTVSSFSIGKYEVTQEEWEAVMGSKPSDYKGAKYPVSITRYNDCQKFIKKLNEKTGKIFRLPREAEWEFAARGGNLSKGYKYAGSNNIDDIAWYDKNSGYSIHEVGQKRANELGIFDMSGNAFELCQDWFGHYNGDYLTNPTGPAEGHSRVQRGGLVWNRSYFMEGASMGGGSYADIGFRLVLVNDFDTIPFMKVVSYNDSISYEFTGGNLKKGDLLTGTNGLYAKINKNRVGIDCKVLSFELDTIKYCSSRYDYPMHNIGSEWSDSLKYFFRYLTRGTVFQFKNIKIQTPDGTEQIISTPMMVRIIK